MTQRPRQPTRHTRAAALALALALVAAVATAVAVVAVVAVATAAAGVATATAAAGVVAMVAAAATATAAAVADERRIVSGIRNAVGGSLDLRGGRGLTCLRGGTEVLAVMRLAARIMPPAAGRRWLTEAESCLYETDPGQRPAIGRDYRRTAPRVVAAAWAAELARGSQALARRRNV